MYVGRERWLDGLRKAGLMELTSSEKARTAPQPQESQTPNDRLESAAEAREGHENVRFCG